MKAAFNSGQILILVLLIVVVALAVGLSVASRNITNLRTSAQTEQSQRAFTAAEGGVEDVLSKLSQVANYIQTGSGPPSGCSSGGANQASCNVSVGSLTATVKVSSQSNYQSVIDLGNVGQVDLGTSPSGSVTIYWGKKNGGIADPLENPPATIAVTQYGGTTCGTAPTAACRKVFQGGPGRSESGPETFDSPGACSPTPYSNCAVVPLQSGATLMRIRPFWVKATVLVSGGNIPVQTFDIVSEAKTAAGVTRKVQVQRTALPQLPAVFDYVLYSSDSINKP